MDSPQGNSDVYLLEKGDRLVQETSCEVPGSESGSQCDSSGGPAVRRSSEWLEAEL